MSSLCLSGFVPLADGSKKLNAIISVVGIVTDLLPPAPTRGADWAITFQIKDFSVDYGSGLKVRIFKKDPSEFPCITSTGDVIFLLGMKVINRSGEILGVSHHSTKWIVFPRQNLDRVISNPKSVLEYTQSSSDITSRSPTELAYAMKLYRQLERHDFNTQEQSHEQVAFKAKARLRSSTKIDPAIGNQPKEPQARPSVPAKRQKFSLVEDLNPSLNGPLAYVDLCCEVRKKYDDYDKLMLSVTDYTSNEHLFKYLTGHEEEEEIEAPDGDPYGYVEKKLGKWLGPWGKRTLVITCFGANGRFIKSNINVGDYVFIRNVFVTSGKNNIFMEGKLRDDPRFPDRMLVQQLTRESKADEFQALLRRKRDYVKRFKQQYDRLKNDAKQSEKRSLDDNGTESEPNRKKTKGQQRREKKREEELKRKKDESRLKSRDILNPNIRCKQIDGVATIPLSNILESPSLSFDTADGRILTLPFQNVCYKTRVRVIDYFPPSLLDFAAPYLESDYDGLSDSSSSSYEGSHISSHVSEDEDDVVDLFPSTSHPNPNGSSRQWEWRFCLLVEDYMSPPPPTPGTPRPHLILQVSGNDGSYLLNEDACDLRKNPQVLSRVREKLFHLWGDLEEAREAAAAAGPADKISAGETSNKHSTVAAAAGGTNTGTGIGGMPFECFIKEYGIPLRKSNGTNNDTFKGQIPPPPPPPPPPSSTSPSSSNPEYERMFQLFGVSISP